MLMLGYRTVRRDETWRAMSQDTSGRRTAVWRALCGVSAAILYAISVSGPAYEATTPTDMPHHVLVRKIYALGAFALLGFLLARSRIPRARGTFAAAVAIGVYSYVIELGQIVIGHSTETFAEHGFDVASGVAGGALGAWFSWMLSNRLSRARRVEAGAIVVIYAALAWFYTLTYGPTDR
jgi:hypothetical protein